MIWKTEPRTQVGVLGFSIFLERRIKCQHTPFSKMMTARALKNGDTGGGVLNSEEGQMNVAFPTWQVTSGSHCCLGEKGIWLRLEIRVSYWQTIKKARVNSRISKLTSLQKRKLRPREIKRVAQFLCRSGSGAQASWPLRGLELFLWKIENTSPLYNVSSLKINEQTNKPTKLH